MEYLDKLHAVQEKNSSWLCIGLDPDPDRLPVEAVWKWDEPLLPFNKAIIDATHDLVCAFKPQIAYYSAEGAEKQLEQTLEYIKLS